MSSQYPHKIILLYSHYKYFIKTLYTDYSSIYSLHFLFTMFNNALEYLTKDGLSILYTARVFLKKMVEVRRLELLTPSLQS